jgi:hypothetical protein
MPEPADRLATVVDYVQSVRRILLDRTKPYRYSDMAIVEALNMALLEARKLRADLFLGRYGMAVPVYNAPTGEYVPIEGQFRLGFVYGIAWQVLDADEEDVQDARANSFLMRFTAMLTGQHATPIQGGTPAPQSAQR